MFFCHYTNRSRKYPKNPKRYFEFHKKLGHATDDYESLKREKERNQSLQVGDRLTRMWETQTYDVEITMIQGGGRNDVKPIKKRKIINIEFNAHDLIPFDHQGIEPLIIKVVVGRTMIWRIYVDNWSSVNIIYEDFLKGLPIYIKKYRRPAMSAVVGFARQSVSPMGKISLPFTIKYYKGNIRKTILTKFIVIKALSPYSMLLGRTAYEHYKQSLPWSTVTQISHWGGNSNNPKHDVRPHERSHVIHPDLIETIFEERISSMDFEEVVFNENNKDQKVKVDTELPEALQKGLVVVLKEYANTFAWKPVDMTRIPRSLIKHRFSINLSHTPIKQKKRIIAKERSEIDNKEFKALVEAGVRRAT